MTLVYGHGLGNTLSEEASERHLLGAMLRYSLKIDLFKTIVFLLEEMLRIVPVRMHLIQELANWVQLVLRLA